MDADERVWFVGGLPSGHQELRRKIDVLGRYPRVIAPDSEDAVAAKQAKHAGDHPIDIAGGASAVRQALQAGCLNELVLDVVPVLLRRGERIFDDVPEFHAEVVEAATSPLATHIVYKIT